MSYEFKTALTRSGNIINPDRIFVTDESVTWEKRNSYLIGKDSTTIPIDKIVSVEINNKGFGTDVTINSYGNGTINAKNFTIGDAKEIKRIIEAYIRNVKNGESGRQSYADEPIIRQPLSQSYEEAIMYVRYDKVPLIKYGNSAEKIVEELDRVMQYANAHLLDSRTEPMLIEAYVSKLEEGLRKLDRLGVKKPHIDDDKARVTATILKLKGEMPKSQQKIIASEKIGFKWLGAVLLLYWKWILAGIILLMVFGG